MSTSFDFILIVTTIVFTFLSKCNGVGHSIGMQDLNSALTKLLYFLDEQHRVINVDCIFCLRIVEGQLESIKENYAAGKLPHVHNTAINSLNKLQQKTALINKKALFYTLGRDPTYTKSFLRVIDTPFMTEHRSRQVQPGFMLKRQGDTDDFIEEVSDKCLSNLLGSEMIEPCTLSNECWRFITMTNVLGYTATHQVLFLLIAEKTGCLHRLEQKVKETGMISVDRLYERICSSIYHEAKQFADGKKFPDDDKDLFMEQIAICAQAGFSEFLDLDWLQFVLSWQSENGCYGENEDDKHLSDEDKKMPNGIFEADENNQEKQVDDNFKQQIENGDISIHRRGVKPVDITKYTGRKLLREEVLPNTGGCLSHMSGVAAACLVMFFHHFLAADHYTAQLFSNHRFIGVNLEGKAIHVNLDSNHHLATKEVKTDENLLTTGDAFPLQSLFIIIFAILLTLYCFRWWRRGNFKSWLKRLF